jgi:late competence protein required for DNA uptake (superfamily II DNA/RNA helicase)
MQESTTGPATILQFRQDIEAQLRRQIREALDVALKEELAAVLASERHERTDQRRGYRNGIVERTITTTTGTRIVTVPRARITGHDGTTREFHSQLLPICKSAALYRARRAGSRPCSEIPNVGATVLVGPSSWVLE